MIFTNPAFLWAFFALSIPIIIHLFNFRRYKTVYFSNTRFVDLVKRDTKTKNKLKQFLILLMRLLFLIALVWAFARPIIPLKNDYKSTKTDAVAIYIDNSFSLELESTKGPLIDQAINNAILIVDALPDYFDYYLITNDFSPQHQRPYNNSEIKQEISKTVLSPLSKNLNEVVSKAKALNSENGNMELYLISDFQKNIFTSVDSLSEQLHINVMALEVKNQNNVFVDSCWFQEPVHSFNHSDQLFVKITNTSDVSYVDIPLRLTINDTLKAVSSIKIDKSSSEILKLDYTNTSKGVNKCKLELSDYPVTFDNDLFFTYRIAEQINVLIINEQLQNKYINTLLQTDENYIKTTQVKAGQEKFDEFSEYNLIVLNGLTNISSGQISELESYISRGNSVLIIPSTESETQMLNQLLQTFDFGAISEKYPEPVEINSIDYSNLLFRDVFLEENENPDLPFLNNVFPLRLNVSSNASSLFADVLGHSLMAWKIYNGGKIYFSAFPLDENVDFMKHPLFVPLFFNIVLQSQPVEDLYYVNGDNNYIEVKNEASDDEYEVIHIVDSVGTDIIPMFRNVQGLTKVFIPNDLYHKAYYEIRSENEVLRTFSLNYNRIESNLSYYNYEDLETELNNIGISNATIFEQDVENLSQIVTDTKQGKVLWMYFVFIAMFFLFGEMLIARLMK